MAGDASAEGGKKTQPRFTTKGQPQHDHQQNRFSQPGRARQGATPYTADAALPPGADVDGAPGGQRITISFRTSGAPSRAAPHHATPVPDIPPLPAQEDEESEEEITLREVAVRDLKAERAGRVFPCMSQDNRYTGCIGYERCKALCWSPRPREREALVRVEQRTDGPCRECIYAREVRGEFAALHGRPVQLIECRLGFWHGRTAIGDFVDGRIALKVRLPCPGFVETDTPHPAVAHKRELARRRARKERQGAGE